VGNPPAAAPRRTQDRHLPTATGAAEADPQAGTAGEAASVRYPDGGWPAHTAGGAEGEGICCLRQALGATPYPAISSGGGHGRWGGGGGEGRDVSPLLSNILLVELDKELERRGDERQGSLVERGGAAHELCFSKAIL